MWGVERYLGRLAFRNIARSGPKAWINASVLALALVTIVFYYGLLEGWNRQARADTQAWEVGQGQLWHRNYDRYDPLSWELSHGPLDSIISVPRDSLVPILLVPGSLYARGRMLNIVIKGIEPNQQILALPTRFLTDTSEYIPALVGQRMAATAGLGADSLFLLRWRDRYGAFDAAWAKVAAVFHTNVPTVDQGQVWIPLSTLQSMAGLEGQATIVVLGVRQHGHHGPWLYRDLKFLFADLDRVMVQKKAGSFLLYGMLLMIALLAVFDTQVFSVFRRQREIGTSIALGMTRTQVMLLFTLEGLIYSLMGLGLAVILGGPILLYFHLAGIPMPSSADQAGLAIASRIVPYYAPFTVILTAALVILATGLASFLPLARIGRTKPGEWLKGKRL